MTEYHAVAVANTKGGTGKTSLALGMAWEAHRRGLRVLIVDVDPQGSATVAAEVVAESERESGPTTLALGENVRRELPTVAQGFDLVVIDTPGSASKRTAAALIAAASAPGGGLVLIPVGSPMDVYALGPGILPIVENVRAIVDLPARFVINGHLSTSTIGADVREALADVDDIPTMDQEIHARTPIARAAAAGLGVTEFNPGHVAARELITFTSAVLDTLGLGDES